MYSVKRSEEYEKKETSNNCHADILVNFINYACKWYYSECSNKI